MAAFATTAARAQEPRLTHAQSAYLESCGGCHGIQGVSAPGIVPDLRDRAGYWLCTEEGRKYVVKLPNVAFAARSDAELADLLNFVVFDLGGASAPKSAKRYTAAEIRALRQETPLITDLRALRRTIAIDVRKVCKAPASMIEGAPGY